MTAVCMCRFRNNMFEMRAADLFAHMRTISSSFKEMTDKELMAKLKRFLVDQSEISKQPGDGGAVGGRSPGKTAFSPKKPKGPDARPAILAHKFWIITIDRKRSMVTVAGDFSIFKLFFCLLID